MSKKGSQAGSKFKSLIQGTETSNKLEQAISQLEGGYAAMATSSGLAAITTSLFAFLSNGDHILVVDTVFGPVRRFCDDVLARYGVETTYYSPTLGEEIQQLIKPNTQVIYMESPGSITFDVQDIPTITTVAQKAGITTILDNTWSSPIFFKAMDFGVNVSIHAATKHISGHSDIVMGIIITDEESWPTLRKQYIDIGQTPPSEEVSLALRGLRTLPLRLKEQSNKALIIARWLHGHPQVEHVYHPALPSCTGHHIWLKYYEGSANLLSFQLTDKSDIALEAFINSLDLFSIGASWGGFESLVLPFKLSNEEGMPKNIIRLSIGLENINDLIHDIECSFESTKATTTY